MPLLFRPLTIRELTIPNRMWVSPMCQYSCFAQDGVPTDWHLVHLGGFALGGFGLIMTEASAVCPEGRISPEDAGIWNDEQRDSWKRIVDFIHSQDRLIGTQLAHAGRKASRYSPFPNGPRGNVPIAERGWQPVAPSPVSFPEYDNTPHELTADEILGVISDFRDAAIRAKDAGFDVIEIHAAHGYLLHEFYSPLSNFRTDDWGGDFEDRTRLVLAVADAIREVWDGPLFVRISATDWTEGGWTIDDSVRLARRLHERGIDLIDVSSASNVPAEFPIGPGYQVPLAQQIHDETDIRVGAVGLITEPGQAESILLQQQADAVFIGRAALREPHWPQRAAAALGVKKEDAPYRPQHERGSWN